MGNLCKMSLLLLLLIFFFFMNCQQLLCACAIITNISCMFMYVHVYFVFPFQYARFLSCYLPHITVLFDRALNFKKKKKKRLLLTYLPCSGKKGEGVKTSLNGEFSAVGRVLNCCLAGTYCCILTSSVIPFVSCRALAQSGLSPRWFKQQFIQIQNKHTVQNNFMSLPSGLWLIPCTRCGHLHTR